MDGQLVHLDIVGGVFGVSPSQDGVGSRVQNILGVGAGQVGGEGDVERVVNRGIGGLGVREGVARLWRVFGMRVHLVDGHIGASHAKVGAHPLGPMTHVRQLIHCESTDGRSGQRRRRRGKDGRARHVRVEAVGQATKLEEARTTDLIARGGKTRYELTSTKRGTKGWVRRVG